MLSEVDVVDVDSLEELVVVCDEEVAVEVGVAIQEQAELTALGIPAQFSR